MAKFNIVTRSTFENHYFVEAETLEEAVEKVTNSELNDFMQKHLGEEVVDGYTLGDEHYEDWMQSNRDRGYF